jgi:hypothetical protein
MLIDEYLQYLQESKCSSATKTYRVRLSQLQRLKIDAKMACDKLKNNPLASAGGYQKCMGALKLRVAAATGRARNERLKIQKYCKKSVGAELAGTKNAPEVSPEEV